MRQPKPFLAALALGITVASGCEVTNPGPVNEQYLTLKASQLGFVNGAEERLARAIAGNAYTTGLVAREIFPGGQTGAGGHAVSAQAGQILHNGAGQYNNGQQARWIAEEAARQFEALGAEVSVDLLFQAYVWAGYSNRFLGENYCEAVIDGGPIEKDSAYFRRAEEAFTKALALNVTPEKKRQAYAGRAQARMWLGNWTGAVSDAGQVPDNFNHTVRVDFTRGGNADQRNQLFWAAEGTYRAYTVRFTYYDAYYTQTGDPRTAWRTYPTYTFCTFSLQGFGQVPCTQQLKYLTQDQDHRVASGGEMRLLEAEALLVAGDFVGAMTKINTLRTSYTSTTTGAPLLPWTATNLAESWTILKRERGIQLWLEGRRMGDQRRWEPVIGQPSTPGDSELPNFESRSSVFTTYPRGREVTLGQANPRVLCFNISDTERNTNPNIPDVG